MLLTLDHGPIREVRLNRPPANALTLELMVALREAIETAPQNGCRALVTGKRAPDSGRGKGERNARAGQSVTGAIQDKRLKRVAEGSGQRGLLSAAPDR